ncbi:MAG: ABC transporter permease [Parvularculaceae bacterium]
MPTAVFSAPRRFDPAAIIRDLVDGLARAEVWGAFAWDETQQRYQRSVFGLAWILISYLFFVGAIAVFFGGFTSVAASHFIIYVSIGYAAFTFLVGNIIDGCDVFRASAVWIKSTSLPYSIYVYKSIARSLLPFAIQLGGAVAIMLYYGWRPTAEALFALPALGVFILNAVWIQIAFGFVAARYHDVQHLISTITRILFFTTPILWVYDETAGSVRAFADINPLTHLIEVFRAPLMGEAVAAKSWLFVLAFTAAGWALAIVVGGLVRRRLPFWV